MNLIAYDPMIEPGQTIDGTEITTFEDVLKRSHFITVHTPLTPETEGMIGPDQIASMMPGSIIVNCARGGIIQEQALADALHSGHLAGAGLDVVEPAPPPDDHPLLHAPNIIITPHTAFFSQASTIELERRTAQEALRVLNGNPPRKPNQPPSPRKQPSRNITPPLRPAKGTPANKAPLAGDARKLLQRHILHLPFALRRGREQAKRRSQGMPDHPNKRTPKQHTTNPNNQYPSPLPRPLPLPLLGGD